MLQEIILNNNINGFHEDGGTDKLLEHSYIEIYNDLLQNFIDKDVSALEIGTYRGGWAFCLINSIKKLKLYSIDIVDNFSQTLLNKINTINNNFSLIIDDAYSINTIDSYFKDKNIKFDLIFEDGPHSLETQIFAIQNYAPLLNSNGFLIIEDIVNDHCLQQLISYINNDLFTYKVHDLRHIKNRHDDILLILQKK